MLAYGVGSVRAILRGYAEQDGTCIVHGEVEGSGFVGQFGAQVLLRAMGRIRECVLQRVGVEPCEQLVSQVDSRKARIAVLREGEGDGVGGLVFLVGCSNGDGDNRLLCCALADDLWGRYLHGLLLVALYGDDVRQVVHAVRQGNGIVVMLGAESGG